MGDGFQERFPIFASEKHVLVLFQDPARAFVSEVTRREAGHGGRALDHASRRRSDPKLQAFRLPFANWLASGCWRHDGNVRRSSVHVNAWRCEPDSCACSG